MRKAFVMPCYKDHSTKQIQNKEVIAKWERETTVKKDEAWAISSDYMSTVFSTPTIEQYCYDTFQICYITNESDWTVLWDKPLTKWVPFCQNYP